MESHRIQNKEQVEHNLKCVKLPAIFTTKTKLNRNKDKQSGYLNSLWEAKIAPVNIKRINLPSSHP